MRGLQVKSSPLFRRMGHQARFGGGVIELFGLDVAVEDGLNPFMR